jgi:hypothetical protein
MARLSIELPDDLRRRMEARAAEAGHATVERYVEALVRADVESDEDYGAPAHLMIAGPDDLRSKIREGLESGPAVEVADQYWDERRRTLRERHAPRADGP